MAGTSGNVKKAWQLRLYVAGSAPKSQAAIASLNRICKTYLSDDYVIEVIDLRRNPDLARKDEVVAVPTVLRLQPAPERKVITDFSDFEQVVHGLEMPGQYGIKESPRANAGTLRRHLSADQ